MITLPYNIHFAASSGSSCPSHLVSCVINVPRRPLARGHLASWFHLEGELLSSVFRSPKVLHLFTLEILSAAGRRAGNYRP